VAKALTHVKSASGGFGKLRALTLSGSQSTIIPAKASQKLKLPKKKFKKKNAYQSIK